MRHRDRFFQDPDQIRRVIYVNGNNLDPCFEHPWASNSGETPAGPDTDLQDNDDFDLEARPHKDNSRDSSLDLEVVSLALEDFKDLGSILRARDILILDDLLQLTDEVRFILKYGAHHLKLYVFAVTQTCLSSPLYSLVQSIHNLVLIFGNSTSTRLAQHLVQAFFLCAETKAYLKAILGIAERQQDTVVLKLNSVASYRPHSNVLALSRVQGLFESDPPYCFVYPELGRAERLETMPRASSSSSGAAIPKLEGEFLEEAFVLLPASQVRMVSEDSAGGSGGGGGGEGEQPSDSGDCLKEKRQRWDEMALFLEREIENSFPLKRWAAAKNLTRELLRCNELCVSPDFRTVFARKKPKWKFSIVDFLNVATRKSAPGERVNEKVWSFRPLVDILLRHDLPETFIVNKLLLSDLSGAAVGRSADRPNPFDWVPGDADTDDADYDDADDDRDDFFGYPRRRRGRGSGRGRRRRLRLLGGRRSRRFGRGPGHRGSFGGAVGKRHRFRDVY